MKNIVKREKLIREKQYKKVLEVLRSEWKITIKKKKIEKKAIKKSIIISLE